MPTNPDLAALSAAATQGVIYGVTLCHITTYRRLAPASPMYPLHHQNTVRYHAPDETFLAALWNAYRTGNLVQIDREGMRERVARGMVKAIGLDFDEPCGYETDADECDSGTCIAAHHEDHDPAYCRDYYVTLADAAIAAILGGEG